MPITVNMLSPVTIKTTSMHVRVFEPLGYNLQNIQVWFVRIIEPRGINQNQTYSITEDNSYRLDLASVGLKAVTNVPAAIRGLLDKLYRASWSTTFQCDSWWEALTVLFPVPVGPMTLSRTVRIALYLLVMHLGKRDTYTTTMSSDIRFWMPDSSSTAVIP